MSASTRADRELVRQLEGLFVGYLNDDELESFERCVKDGYAARQYNEVGAILGLSKVKYIGGAND